MLDFELEEEPPMYEPFVFTFTWSGGDVRSGREGEVITSSQQVVRTDDGWVYPRHTDDGNIPTSPNWNGSGIHNDVWEGYDAEDVYLNKFEAVDDTTAANIVRLSHYGRWSEKPSELASEGNRKDDSRDYSTTGAGEFIGTTSPDYFNAPLNNLWSVDYEITEGQVEEAKSVAASQKPQTGNELADVYEMINSPEVVNHEIVQEIAQKIGDVCEGRDATAPTEQLRVVADFVQYLDYAYFENFTNSPTGNYSSARGTAHPVETLERGFGDCKDYTVLMNALIQQEPFNFNPRAGVFNDIDVFSADDIDGHVSTGVPLEELEIEGIVDDDIFQSSPRNFNECQFTYDGKPYMYIETSIPNPMGYIYDHPEYDDASGIDNYV